VTREDCRFPDKILSAIPGGAAFFIEQSRR
jgi:hypothetical protein